MQLFQHHLQLVHLACQIQGWLPRCKGRGGGVRISAHSWEEPGLQAPLVPEALGSPLPAGYQGCLVGEGCTLQGRAPHLVGLGSTRPEVSGSPPTEG